MAGAQMRASHVQTHRALVACNVSCATWYEGTAQLSRLIDCHHPRDSERRGSQLFTVHSLHHVPFAPGTLTWLREARAARGHVVAEGRSAFFFFFFGVPQLYLWGSPLLGEIFALSDRFV